MVVLGLLVLAAGQMELGAANPFTLAQSGHARTGLDMLEDSGIGSGALAPFELLTRGNNPDDVAASMASIDGMHGAVAPDSPQWRRGGLALVNAFGTANPSASASVDTLDRVQETAGDAPGTVLVGGQIAENQDFIDAVYGNFPLMILLIGLITFVLLARAFRSIVLPLKAIVLNVISVAAAWGVLTIVWQEGHGSEQLWGIPATGSLPVVDPDRCVRVLVRAIDGLRGLHPRPHARVLRRRPGHEPGRDHRHRAHRAAGDERGADPVPRVRVAGVRAADTDQTARDRAGGRDHHRRDDHPRTTRPGGRVAVREVELVAAQAPRTVPSGGALQRRRMTGSTIER